MMKRFLCCVMLLVLTGCGSNVATTAPSSDNGLHLVIDVQGQLSVKRESWSKYAPALFGTALRTGDLLQLEVGSQARVVCADVTMVTAPNGVGGVPCKVAKPVLTYRGSQVNVTRDGTASGYPMVLSPRKTKLLNAHPTLRWTAVPGATQYTVSISGAKWSTEVNAKTEIVYPESAPALTPGTDYKVIVVAGNRSSEDESKPSLGFTLLTPNETQTVRDAETKIRTLDLADAPTRFLIANLYATQGSKPEDGLNAEAIEQLEGLSSTLQERNLVRALGDLYLKVGLNRLAEERYSQALKLSESVNDVEGQALAQDALGRIYEALGNKGEASQRYQKAIESYQKLGDTKSVAQIQERLAKLR